MYDAEKVTSFYAAEKFELVYAARNRSENITFIYTAQKKYANVRGRKS